MQKYEKLYASDSVWKAIAKLSIPSLIIMLLMVFYNIADLMFIGQLGSTAMVAAISLVGPLFSLLMAFATMIGFGGATRITNALGRNDLQQAARISSVCFFGGLLAGLALIPVLLAARYPILSFLGATDETIAYAERYYTILTLGAPFLLLSTLLGSILRSDGSIRESLIGNLSGTIANLILDPLFILAFGWGVSGAAAATVIGNVLSTIIYFLCVRRSKVLSLRPRDARHHMGLLGPVLALGLPNAVSTFLSGISQTFANNLLKPYGTDAIAAMSAAGKVSMLTTMLVMGIVMGCQPLLAYCHGSGDRKRMRDVLLRLLLLTTAIGLAAAAGSLAGRRALIGLMLKQPGAADLAASFVPFLMCSAPVCGIYYLSVNYLQASLNAVGASVLSALRQGAILIPALWGLNALLGVTGIVLAHTVSDFVAAAVGILLFVIQVRRNQRADSPVLQQKETPAQS
ncbi:MAG: MATE family efflux transporter [Lachnospiraceae bacterium]